MRFFDAHAADVPHCRALAGTALVIALLLGGTSSRAQSTAAITSASNEAQYKTEMEKARAAFGPQSVQFKTAATKYLSMQLSEGIVALTAHDAKKAKEILGALYNTSKTTLGADDPLTNVAKTFYTNALEELGETDKIPQLLGQTSEPAADSDQQPAEELETKSKEAEAQIDVMQKQADDLLETGSSEAAFEKLSAIIKLKVSVYGESDYRTGKSVADAGEALLHMSRDREAEEYFERAIGIYHASPIYGEGELFTEYRDLATALAQEGRLREAELYLRRALGLDLRTLIDPDSSEGAAATQMADNLHGQGRDGEAISYYVQALNLYGDAFSHPGSISQSGTKGVLESRTADAVFDLGFRDAAKPLFIAAYTDARDTSTDLDSGCQSNQAFILSDIALRYADAPLADLAEGCMRYVVGSGSSSAKAKTQLGLLLALEEHDREAIEILQAALQQQKQDPDSPLTARIERELAKLDLGMGQAQEALVPARAALAAERAFSLREDENAAESLHSASKIESPKAANILIRAAFSVSAGRAPALLSEAFSAAQSLADTGAGRALLQSAARATLPAEGQALARERDNTLADEDSLDHALSKAPVAGDDNSDARRAKLVEQRENLDAVLAGQTAKLAAAYPKFTQLVAPDAVTVADLQKSSSGRPVLLHPDEALILFTAGDTSLPAAEQRGFVFAVTAEGSAWAEIKVDPAELKSDIIKMRASLDPVGGKIPVFDRALSRTIYDSLFSDPTVASLIASKSQWIVSPQGDLLSLPFAALVTGAFDGSDGDAQALRATPWLGLTHDLSILPEIASLRALRSGARTENAERVPFFGVGDPNFQRGASPTTVRTGAGDTTIRGGGDEGGVKTGVLVGSQQPTDAALVATEATLFSQDELKADRETLVSGVRLFEQSPTSHSPPVSPFLDGQPDPAPQEASIQPAPRAGDVGDASSYLRGGSVDVDRIQSLPRLAGSGREVEAIAASLSAPPGSTLTGDDATEENLRALNDSGSLAKARVIVFATHGLIAGDFHGALDEPALALAPGLPGDRTQGVQNDGLLTASEAAGLKLDADWIILSACNTAAGGRPDAQGLSGLARSFFYAGADSLLVSHWRISDLVSSRLTTRAVQIRLADPKSTRAAALRQAMREVMQDTSRDKDGPGLATPTLWAAFELVGVDR